MNTITAPVAVVQMAEETEEQVVAACRELVAKENDCKWQEGRLAHDWTKRFAKGRTDADFAKLVGLSEDQVQRRRKVFSTYGDVSASMRNLTWTHFLTVLAWDDAEEWLAEANSESWSVATMKRMRDVRIRMENGEDLTEQAENDHFSADATGEADDVQDVDPYQQPPSINKPTPKAFTDDTDDRAKDKVTMSPPGSTTPAPSAPDRPSESEASVTLTSAIDNIAALVTALKPQLKKKSGHTLAVQLRRWADEIDPPKHKPAGGPTIPEELDTPAARQAFDEWREYRRQSKKKLTQLGEQKLLTEWAQRGSTAFVAAVNHSISNGWQGLFEPEGKHGNASNARALSEGRAVGDNWTNDGVF